MAVTVSPVESERLVAELHRWDVRHLSRLDASSSDGPMPLPVLLMALARHPEARMRSALILLFLRQPQFNRALPTAVRRLPSDEADTLRLYYQAAAYLQRELERELRPHVERWQSLPDLYSHALGLPAADTVQAEPGAANHALAFLGQVHRRLSRRNLNWAGSYRQHLPLFLKQLTTARGPKRD